MRARYQDLRRCSVQIRNTTNEAIVGTGVIVSTAGDIITCAHVLRAAGVEPRTATPEEVYVRMPQVSGIEAKTHLAKVMGCFDEYDDDVVLLRVVDTISLPPEQVAILGRAEDSFWNKFRSYGYRDLEYVTAGWAEGCIHEDVEQPHGKKLQADPLELSSPNINKGMSGAAVLDINPDRNLVVGIITHSYFPDATTKDRDTGWAVNAQVLTLNPLNLPLQDEPVPLGPTPEPRGDIAPVLPTMGPSSRHTPSNAPPPLTQWVGRADMLADITTKWLDRNSRMMSLIGFGGEGKTSLARYWLKTLLDDTSLPQPEGVFWWGFYDQPNVDEFFEAALTYLSGGNLDLRMYPSSNARAHLIAAMLGNGRFLFILDGLEVLQYLDGERYGLIINPDLRDFLTFFAAPNHESFCLITSRVPVELS